MTQLQQLFTWLAAGIPVFLALGVAIGGIGSLLEAIGVWKNWPALVAIGQKFEAIGADIPKLLSKLPKVPASLIPLVLGLTFAATVAACSLFGSGGALAPVADCAPTAPELEHQVANILTDGTEYSAKLDDLAQQIGKDGLATVECAVQAYLGELAAVKMAASPAQAAAKERGKAYLASKGGK